MHTAPLNKLIMNEPAWFNTLYFAVVDTHITDLHEYIKYSAA